jgi:L-histidine Nalpha-methyltransferase
MASYRGDRLAFGGPGNAPRWARGDKGGAGSNQMNSILTGPSSYWYAAGSITQPIFSGGRILGSDHPIMISPAEGKVRVTVAGRIVAESARALRPEEKGYPPVYYLPRNDDVSNHFVASPEAVRIEAVLGLSARQKSLPAWLFYDAIGSGLFEQITELPEYYPTRTERALLAKYSDEILDLASAGKPVSISELGAGTATKAGILLQAAICRQEAVFYQPIDVCEVSLDAACENINQRIPGVTVVPHLSNYVTEPIRLDRHAGKKVLVLFIGSSIGNFLAGERVRLLRSLRDALEPAEGLLLGTDLAPGQHKSLPALFAAYDDSDGVTAKFNLNILTRLNRELGMNFNPSLFRHLIRWNAAESRIEMHLESLVQQQVMVPAGLDGMELRISFNKGETIHTENSFKFNSGMIDEMLNAAGFSVMKAWTDPLQTFAVTLAGAR